MNRTEVGKYIYVAYCSPMEGEYIIQDLAWDRIVIEFVRRHLIALLSLLVALLGLAAGVQQYRLQKAQFSYEKSQHPHLEYSYEFVFSEVDSRAIQNAAEELTRTVEGQVRNYTETRPGATYFEAVNAVLPVTTTVSAQVTSVRTLVHNNGGATAKNVRVFFSSDRIITARPDVHSREPNRIIQGGVGEKHVTVEVDRMLGGDRADISVALEDLEPDTQTGMVVLEMSGTSPRFRYVSKPDSRIVIQVSDDEDSGTLVAEYPKIAIFDSYSSSLSEVLTQLQLVRDPGCMNIDRFVPDKWTLLYTEEINIDKDFDEECLTVFLTDYGAREGGNAVGAVVYDPRPSRDFTSLATPVDDWPSTYAPYPLLPRKNGRGFLTERIGDWSEMIQVWDVDGDSIDELVFLGFSGYDFPTYLSVFKWQDKGIGYYLMTSHQTGEGGLIWGDAGVSIEREARIDEESNVALGPIVSVVAMTRPSQPFWYFRSQLCYANIYRWNSAKTALEIQDYYLTFCFGRPSDSWSRQNAYNVWYPEEALLAWFEEGEVREIALDAGDLGEETVSATVTLRQNTQQDWAGSFRLHEKSGYLESGVPVWEVEAVGLPFRP